MLVHLDWSGEGRDADIGCGNGPLTIALARRHPKARVTWIDSWSKGCDYSRRACEGNAQALGVAERTDYQNATASALLFADGVFDAAVSNFVFHEVTDTKDKRELVKEALRVVRKGGRFAFQDPFLIKALYGGIDDLMETIKGWGAASVSFADTSASDYIPRALKLPFMVGKIGIIYGTKCY